MIRHHHAVCSHCGTITDFTWDFFDQVQVPEETDAWETVAKRNVVFQGTCKACAGKS